MGGCRGSAGQEVGAVEGGTLRDIVDLFHQRGDFGLDRGAVVVAQRAVGGLNRQFAHADEDVRDIAHRAFGGLRQRNAISRTRSEEHTSELQSLMRISYAVFCLKKKIVFMS